MSEGTPRPPAGPPGPPAGPPGPPGPWTGPPPAARPPGLSNTARFWIGVPIGVFGAPVVVVVAIIAVSALSSESYDSPNALLAYGGLVVLALVVAGLVVRATRWFVLGAVAGAAVTAIVLGGACVALIRAMGG